MYIEITPSNNIVQFRYQTTPDYNSQIIDFAKLKQDLVVTVKYENGAWTADHTYYDMQQAIANGVLVRLTDETNERFSIVSGYTDDSLYFVTEGSDGVHTYTVTDADAWSLRTDEEVTEVLYATYGTTTYADIVAAKNAGKVVVCQSQTGGELLLATVVASKAVFMGAISDALGKKIEKAECTSANVWSRSYDAINDCFRATYGSTSYDDVDIAFGDDFKLIYALNGSECCIYTHKSGSSYVFSAVEGNSLVELTLASDDSWTRTVTTLYVKPSGGIPSTDLASAVQTSLGKADTAEQVANKVTSISSASTDTQYPSAKCVYDEVSQLGQEVTDKNRVVTEAIAEHDVELNALEQTRDRLGHVEVLSITSRTMPRYDNVPLILYGAGAPSASVSPVNWDIELCGEWTGIPCFIGQLYINTSASANALYVAVNTSAVSGWKTA